MILYSVLSHFDTHRSDSQWKLPFGIKFHNCFLVKITDNKTKPYKPIFPPIGIIICCEIFFSTFFLFLYYTLFRLDSTFWLDSMLILYYDIDETIICNDNLQLLIVKS